MSRRAFLKSLTALVGGFALPAIAHAKPNLGTWKTLQTSPLAGFQYHHSDALWPQLAVGQPLHRTGFTVRTSAWSWARRYLPQVSPHKMAYNMTTIV